MKKIKHAIFLFLSMMGIWLLLTSLALQEVIAGVIISGLITIFTWNLEPVLGDLKITPKSIFSIFVYILVFMKELVVSNLDVAFRVVKPSLPINPGFVVVKTKLKSDIGKLVLANSITLTPGTLTTEIDGENLYIHWIYITEDDIEGATKEIVSKFEKHLEVIFG